MLYSATILAFLIVISFPSLSSTLEEPLLQILTQVMVCMSFTQFYPRHSMLGVQCSAGHRTYAHNRACWTGNECGGQSEHIQNDDNHEHAPAPAKTPEVEAWN
jgi:hypothetical protein